MSGLRLDLKGYDRLYDRRAGSTLWGDEPGRLVRRLGDWVSEAGRALDAGCGDGKNAAWLEAKGWNVTGFDRSSLALSLLRGRRPEILGDFHCQDLHEFLSSSQETFDLIVSYGLFHCLDATKRVEEHRELQGRLRPGGVLLFSTLTDLLPWPHGHGTTEFRLAAANEIDALIEGFHVLYREDGILTEDHLPHVATHQHSSHWHVLARPR